MTAETLCPHAVYYGVYLMNWMLAQGVSCLCLCQYLESTADSQDPPEP